MDMKTVRHLTGRMKNTDSEPGFCKKTFIFNQGMDACCGLYDEYYWFYTVPGYVEE